MTVLTTIIGSNVDFISLLHVGFPYSENYAFHIGLAYRILPINEPSTRALLAATEEKVHNMLVESKQFSLLSVSTPELCTHENMSAFHKI